MQSVFHSDSLSLYQECLTVPGGNSRCILYNNLASKTGQFFFSHLRNVHLRVVVKGYRTSLIPILSDSMSDETESDEVILHCTYIE